MIYLMMAIVCSASVSIIMRFSERKVKANVSMLAVNYIVCFLCAGIFSGIGNLLPIGTEGLPWTLGVSVFNGFFYLSGFIFLQSCVKKNGVVLSTTFIKLGLLVPMAVSILVFKEAPTVVQIIGFLITVFAIILMNFEKEEVAGKFSFSLILLLLTGGSCDAMSKMFEEIGNPLLSNQFLFYTFICAFLMAAGLAALRKERPGKSELFYGIVIGVPNYFSARFFLRSLSTVPAVIAAPSCSVGTIVVVTLVGMLLFKEKLGKRQKVALGAILAALVLLNI